MGEIEKSSTFRLFARPSFIEGMARLIDLACYLQYYHYNQTPGEADTQALRSDWHTVGRDLKATLQEYGRASESNR